MKQKGLPNQYFGQSASVDYTFEPVEKFALKACSEGKMTERDNESTKQAYSHLLQHSRLDLPM